MSSESELRMWLELETQAHHQNPSSPKIPSVGSAHKTLLYFTTIAPSAWYINPSLSCATVKPGPPVNLQAIDHTKESVTLSWKPPTDTGRGKIFGYLLEYQKAGEEEWIKVRWSSIFHLGHFERRLLIVLTFTGQLSTCTKEISKSKGISLKFSCAHFCSSKDMCC